MLTSHPTPSQLVDALRHLLAGKRQPRRRVVSVPATPKLHGAYRHAMDLKGRVVLPLDFLRQMGPNFYVVRAASGYLMLLPSQEVPQLAAAWVQKRETTALWLAGLYKCRIDPNTGRFLIPAELRDWAGLNAYQRPQVALAGVGDAVLLCEASRWDAEVLAAHEALLGGGK